MSHDPHARHLGPRRVAPARDQPGPGQQGAVRRVERHGDHLQVRVRRAVGDAAGLTVKAQVRQAARNLGFPDGDWRLREARYGRAGGWGAAALDGPRARFAAWRAREAAVDASALAGRLRDVRAGLARLDRGLAGVEAEVARLAGSAPDA